MKNLKFLGVVAMTTVLLTSCLDGGNNEKSGFGYGVAGVSMDAMGYAVYVDDNMSVYSPSFNGLTDDDCVQFTYKINYDDPVNSGSPKYWTSSESTYIKLDNKGYVETVVDTTKASIKKNEMAAVDVAPLFINEYGATVKNFLFLNSSHQNSSTDQTNSYTLQVDLNQEPEVVDGNNVYNLFLRVVKVGDGKTTVGNSAFGYAIRAGNVFSTLESKEKAKDKDAFYFRFNYIKEFNKDSTEVTWGKSKVCAYKIYKGSK